LYTYAIDNYIDKLIVHFVRVYETVFSVYDNVDKVYYMYKL